MSLVLNHLVLLRAQGKSRTSLLRNHRGDVKPHVGWVCVCAGTFNHPIISGVDMGLSPKGQQQSNICHGPKYQPLSRINPGVTWLSVQEDSVNLSGQSKEISHPLIRSSPFGGCGVFWKHLKVSHERASAVSNYQAQKGHLANSEEYQPTEMFSTTYHASTPYKWPSWSRGCQLRRNRWGERQHRGMRERE